MSKWKYPIRVIIRTFVTRKICLSRKCAVSRRSWRGTLSIDCSRVLEQHGSRHSAAKLLHKLTHIHTGWRKKRGHHLTANILKFHNRIAWNWWISAILYAEHIINFLFKNFIALRRHLAKTQLLSFIHILQIDLSITQNICNEIGWPRFCATLRTYGTARRYIPRLAYWQAAGITSAWASHNNGLAVKINYMQNAEYDRINNFSYFFVFKSPLSWKN